MSAPALLSSAGLRPGVRDGLDPDVLEAAWSGSAALRARAHRGVGHPGCPARRPPYRSATTPEGCRTADCLGILHEVYLVALRRLEAVERGETGAVRSRAAYARRVVATVVADTERATRVARGAPARPGRDDGPAQRVNAAIEASSREATVVRWRLALFRLMRSWVHRDDRQLAGWPLEAWTAEKCLVDGVPRLVAAATSSREVLADVQLVLAVATETAGPAWVAQSLLGPLQLLVPSPLDETVGVADPGPDLADAFCAAEVRRQYARLRADGASAEVAWRDAVRRVVGAPPVRPVSAVIHDLEPLTRRGGSRAAPTGGRVT